MKLYFSNGSNKDVGWLQSAFKRHHDELPINGIPLPLDINYEYYEALEASGKGYLLIAENIASELVGYMLFSIHGHPHYRTIRFASSEAFWVDPKYRKSLGLSIIRQMTTRAELDLKYLHNVDILSLRINPIKDISKIFKRMEYNESCIYLSKKL